MATSTARAAAHSSMVPALIRGLAIVVLALAALMLLPGQGKAQGARVTALKQAIAQAAAKDAEIAAFYKANGYKTIWVGRSGRENTRRTQLLRYLNAAGTHGLPVSRYNPDALKKQMRAAKTPQEQGKLEVEMSRVFLRYARDVQTGIMVPSRVDRAIVRQVPYRDRLSYLVNFAKSQPAGFFRALPPRTTEYVALTKEKMRLERVLGRGGWGQKVPGSALKPGATGNAVVILRNRLMAMGYLKRTNTKTYDTKVQAAVQQFQLAHGLAADGVAGKGTIAEINKPVTDRLKSVLVAMERERWFNRDRGRRHVLVNIPDFTAKVIDGNKVTFQTRAVVGANDSDRRTPEFSDVMEFMVVNPSWYVPRSIVTKEYLPALKRNPNAVKHIEITDSKGRKVNRGAVNFAQYTEKTFPFAMRQPPSRGNALGLVKFMFPNKHNIYLHDTPAKNLFSREVRAYSHGCIRLNDPFDFAYTLLAKQTGNPEGVFQTTLKSGKETTIDLKQPVPVHIVYRTAFIDNKGRAQFRRDIYGRDGRIWNALAKSGVALRAVQG